MASCSVKDRATAVRVVNTRIGEAAVSRNVYGSHRVALTDAIAAALTAARQEEREACAKVAEEVVITDQHGDEYWYGYREACKQTTEVIRARGENKP
jgi:squalene cyclase